MFFSSLPLSPLERSLVIPELAKAFYDVSHLLVPFFRCSTFLRVLLADIMKGGGLLSFEAHVFPGVWGGAGRVSFLFFFSRWGEGFAQCGAVLHFIDDVE
jgi:hypothetical protein